MEDLGNLSVHWRLNVEDDSCVMMLNKDRHMEIDRNILPGCSKSMDVLDAWVLIIIVFYNHL